MVVDGLGQQKFMRFALIRERVEAAAGLPRGNLGWHGQHVGWVGAGEVGDRPDVAELKSMRVKLLEALFHLGWAVFRGSIF